MLLNDHTIIITGAGRGIGARTARLLAGHGANVVLCSRTRTEVEEVARSIVAAGGRATATAADVGSPDDVARLVELATSHFPPPTGLINNAAVLGPVGPLVDVAVEDWWGAMRTTLLGTAAMCAAFAPVMPPGGSIVNLSGGGIGGPNVAERISAYTTAKAAVVTLTETLAVELADAGIRINAVAPGAFATTFTDGILEAGAERAGAELFEATRRNQQGADGFDRYADLLLYLLSAEGDWVTGRLLSARWETPDRLRQLRRELSDSRFKLRRVDEDLYGELPRS